MRKGRPLPQVLDNELSILLKNYFISRYGRIPGKIDNAVKYYAAVVKHPVFKREIMYRYEEGDEVHY